MSLFICVAEPGIAPGLEDYASVAPIPGSVGLYLHPELDSGAWRVVSTDSLHQIGEGCLGITLLLHADWVSPIQPNSHLSVTCQWAHIEPSVQLYTTPRYINEQIVIIA